MHRVNTLMSELLVDNRDIKTVVKELNSKYFKQQTKPSPEDSGSTISLSGLNNFRGAMKP